MVILHTWLPLSPELAFEGFRPDAGHSSMEVLNNEGSLISYISFWPEPESLIGQVTQLLKPRPQRHPLTYSQECDPQIGYMQRPADYNNELVKIDQEVMVDLWTALRDTGYDLLHWNCSSICKLLILSAADPSYHKNLETAAICAPEDLAKIASTEDFLEKLRYLATSPFIDCRPDDVRRMVEAYVNMIETMAGETQQNGELAPIEPAEAAAQTR